MRRFLCAATTSPTDSPTDSPTESTTPTPDEGVAGKPAGSADDGGFNPLFILFGALVLVPCCIVLACLFVRRRQQKREKDEDGASDKKGNGTLLELQQVQSTIGI